MVHFVGAGPGAVDLITVRGQRLIREADVILYAGSLVNPALLEEAKQQCEIYNTAVMTLDEVLKIIEKSDTEKKRIVRLHTGDPSIYGTIREQMDALEQRGISYEVCPGVSSFCAAAAALNTEYTLPEVSQTVIITRAEGRTSVPERERLSSLAAHGATMVLFLSAALLHDVKRELLNGGYDPDTPCAIVYKATWPEQRIVRGALNDLPKMAEKNDIRKTALILVGNFLGDEYALSRLYAPDFQTEYRDAVP